MVTTTKQIFENNPLIFGINLSELDDRLDCAWFNPIIEDKLESLRTNRRAYRKLSKLKIVSDVSGGKRLPGGTVVLDSELNLIPYVRAMDIKNLKVNLDPALKIPKEIHQKIQNYQLQKDDIVITIVGTIGEVGILEESVDVCDFTENIARVRIKDSSVLPQFLLHFLNSEFGKMQTERFSVGSLQYKLSLQSCRNIEVYIPFTNDTYDVSQQKKILNEVYSILRVAEDKRQESIRLIKEANEVVVQRIGLALPVTQNQYTHYFEQELDEETSSRLDTLFNNPLREELLNTLKKYPHKILSQLIQPQGNSRIISSDFYRLVELEQIDEKTGRIVETKEVPELGSEKVLLKLNSIIITKLQPEGGKIAIVIKEFDGCVGSSELLPFELKSSVVTLDYLWAVLRSGYVLKQWEFELTGSSRMRIGPNEINNTIIPVPDTEVQNEIVAEIKDKIYKSDKLFVEVESLFGQAKEKFEKLLVEN